MNFIEGDSITDDEEVAAGRNNPRITGDDKEYAVIGEKMTNFDTKCWAINPELSNEEIIIYLHIDVEPQKKYNPGYPIEKRGIYYLARELSAQLSVVTEETDYGKTYHMNMVPIFFIQAIRKCGNMLISLKNLTNISIHRSQFIK